MIIRMIVYKLYLNIILFLYQGSSYSDYDYTDDSIQTTTEYIEDREQRDVTGDAFEVVYLF